MPKSKGPPSATTIKARRRRGFRFQDEPVQWHLNTSEHDKCPWCGIQNMMYFGKLQRSCGNSACNVSIDLSQHYKSGKEFLEKKLGGAPASDYGGPPSSLKIYVPDGETAYDLNQAQKMSHNGRARLHAKFGYDDITVYWHRVGHLPEDEEANRVVVAGSDYWYWLVSKAGQQVWVPDEALTPLEVLAKAATDDPVFMVTSY